MVSSMGFAEVATAYAAHCAKLRSEEEVESRAELLAFLDMEDADDEDPVISSDVRIMLVSADFGREITTTVLWLNRFDSMDIRCVRLVPYDIDGRVLLDIQQVLPLPEAADYQVRLRRKDAARERVVRGEGRDLTRYEVVVDGEALPDENKRNAVRVMVEQLLAKGVTPADIAKVIPAAKWRKVDGEYNDPVMLATEMRVKYPRINIQRRYFLDHPVVEDGKTWVLSNQWGTKTEPTLSALADAFPEAKVTFRQANKTSVT
jgi:hypothetical protein